MVKSLFENNAGCILPCWWGITPGETKWQSAKQFLEQFAQTSYDVSSNGFFDVGSAFFFLPEDIFFSGLEHFYTIQDGIVEEIDADIPPYDFESYRLSNFLDTYGIPEEIWISTYSNFYNNEGYMTLPFGIVLFYPQAGIMANYWSDDIKISGEQVFGCRNNGIASHFWLWSDVIELTFLEASERYGLDIYDLFLPLEDATNMDIETFFNTFRTPNNSTCIKTPTELWPEQ